MLGQHPNLNCDLAGMANTGRRYGSGWPRSELFTALIEDGGGLLFPGMKKLFEDFPDRFALGMDLEQIPSRLNQSATTNLRNINKIEHDT